MANRGDCSKPRGWNTQELGLWSLRHEVIVSTDLWIILWVTGFQANGYLDQARITPRHVGTSSFRRILMPIDDLFKVEGDTFG
jgi:hypothetical protein